LGVHVQCHRLGRSCAAPPPLSTHRATIATHTHIEQLRIMRGAGGEEEATGLRRGRGGVAAWCIDVLLYTGIHGTADFLYC
jgi:hypothetical protein